MRAVAVLEVGHDPAGMAARAAATARRELGGPADLVAVFAHPALVDDPALVLDAVHEGLSPGALIGCTGEAVVGGAREVEDTPALVVWAARMPGATIRPVRAHSAPSPAGGVEVRGWPPAAPRGADPGVVVLLTDPFSFHTDVLLARLEAEGGHPPVIGGMASGALRPGGHRLFLDREHFRDGAVAVHITGVPFTLVVSQGCIPVGPEMVITDADPGGVVHALAGRPAVEKIEEVIAEFTPHERTLAAGGLLAGIVIDENRPEYGRGDFLVRGIIGADGNRGSVRMGDEVRVGQTVRLHVRDPSTARRELRDALGDARDALDGAAAGALLFTCNGRGTAMFRVPDHDASQVLNEFPGTALAGLFCNGEIGPVGGRVFMHGFTATMLLLGSEHPSPHDG